MQAEGNAHLVESSYGLTTPDQMAKIRSVREFAYPSEYDNPEIPQDLTGPIDTAANIAVPAAPVDYETRLIGNLLEFKPVPRAGSTIYDLEHSSELAEFVEFKTWGQGRTEMRYPYFHRNGSKAELQLKPGRSTLLGTFVPTSKTSTKRLLGFATLTKMSAASATEFKEFLTSPPTKKFSAPPSLIYL